VKYLLDSVAWLWSIATVERLSQPAREILDDPQQQVYFSAATGWELSIKARSGKLTLPGTPAECIPAFTTRQGLLPLPVTLTHALRVYDLPLHHTDPFDRLLIAQAILEEMTLLTADRIFAKYPVDILWCGK